MKKGDYDIWKPKSFKDYCRGEKSYGSFVSVMTSTIPPYRTLKWESENVLLVQICPFCGIGRSKIETGLSWNGSDGQYLNAFYICDHCYKTFTTTEIDEITLNPVFKRKQKIHMIIEIIKNIKLCRK